MIFIICINLKGLGVLRKKKSISIYMEMNNNQALFCLKDVINIMYCSGSE